MLGCLRAALQQLYAILRSLFTMPTRPTRHTRKVIRVIFIPGFVAVRIDRYDEAVGIMMKRCYFDISKPSRSRLARAIGNRMALGWSLHQKPDVWAVAAPDVGGDG